MLNYSPFHSTSSAASFLSSHRVQCGETDRQTDRRSRYRMTTTTTTTTKIFPPFLSRLSMSTKAVRQAGRRGTGGWQAGERAAAACSVLSSLAATQAKQARPGPAFQLPATSAAARQLPRRRRRRRHRHRLSSPLLQPSGCRLASQPLPLAVSCLFSSASAAVLPECFLRAAARRCSAAVPAPRCSLAACQVLFLSDCRLQ